MAEYLNTINKNTELNELFNIIEEYFHSNEYTNEERMEVLRKYSKKYSKGIREIWFYFAKYKLLELDELKKLEPFKYYYGQKNCEMQNSISSLILRLSYYDSSYFGGFLVFINRFMDRLNYIINRVFLRFLENANGVDRYSKNMKVKNYFDILIDEIMIEIEEIKEISVINPFSIINNSYEKWITKIK